MSRTKRDLLNELDRCIEQLNKAKKDAILNYFDGCSDSLRELIEQSESAISAAEILDKEQDRNL